MFSIFLCITGSAQIDSLLKSQRLSRVDRYTLSKQATQNLKNGALLVRLKTKSKSINALKEKGRAAQAEQVEAKVNADNLDLYRAFQDEWNFCPVYFFNSDDSEHVINGQIDSVKFLNEELQADASIKMEKDFFLVAELGLLEQDRSKIENVRSGQENNPNYRNEAKYYGGANMRFHALLMKSSEFEQLRAPFPHYSRTLNSFFIKKKMKDVVKTLNLKLQRFSAPNSSK